MKEIAVFGEFDSDNIGDVLIGKGQQLVYKANKKDFITVSLELNKRTHSSTAEQVKANPIILILKKVHRLFYKKNYLYRHILEVSLYLTSKHAYISHGEQSLTFGETIVIGGGQLFNDNTLRMLLRIFSLVSIAKSKKRRVLVIGSGVTTPKTFISNYLLSKIFSQIENKDIYLRDMKSIQVVNSLIDTSLDSSNHIPDFAIPYISSAYKKNKQIVNRVGLAPIFIGSIPKKYKNLNSNTNQWWVNFAEFLNKKGIQPVLFCSGTKEDFMRCSAINELAQSRKINLEIIARPTSINSFINILLTLDNVVCQRLHISISSFSLGMAPCSLPWDDKVQCFYEDVNLSSHFIKDDNYNFDHLFSVLYDKPPQTVPADVINNKINNIISHIDLSPRSL